MATVTQPVQASSNARVLPGELVEVLSESEIRATLDEKGTLENLPFMPEMLKFCGKKFRVSAQAFKTCVDDQEMRQLDTTVFLEEVRCDGASHGGCDRACLIFWKEAWLKRSEPTTQTSLPILRAKLLELLETRPLQPGGLPPQAQTDLQSLAMRDGQFFCQSTEILNASKPLPWWEPRQYLWDLKYNRVSPIQWIKSLLIAIYNKVAYICQLKSWRFVAGSAEGFHEQSLNLRPGELVRVKSLSQIKKTLDSEGKHQHLLFAPTMMTFCGQVLRVQDRVENIILEGTPRQRKIKDTVLLEGATCDGICHRLCPRQSFLFWRECWLERVAP
ncbi:MAG: hypothetical protein AABN95_02115 [Acidobacteriota bacterium]